MVPLRVLSRTSLAGFSPSTSSISFASFRLRTLFLSLRSFSDPHRLFSTTSALFLQNTRGGIPLRDLVSCTEAQKRLFLSPLVATLTHSVSRKSFPCHSYRNTRDGGVTVASVSASMSLCLCGNPNFARPFPIRLPRSARGTNCFSRNSFIFKSIHIPGGVEQKRNQRGMGWRTIYSRAFALVGRALVSWESRACC